MYNMCMVCPLRPMDRPPFGGEELPACEPALDEMAVLPQKDVVIIAGCERGRRRVDGMTGLLQKETWRQNLDEHVSHVEEAWKDGHSVAVVFLDLDNFKKVNDQNGHEAGDRVIEEIAKVLDSNTRTSRANARPDRLTHERRYKPREDQTDGRLGGDEFALLVPLGPRREDAAWQGQREGRLSHEAQVRAIMTRIKAKFEEFKEENPELSVPGLGISMGGAIWEPGMTAADLIEAADMEMYRDKVVNKEAYIAGLAWRQRITYRLGKWLLQASGEADSRS